MEALVATLILVLTAAEVDRAVTMRKMLNDQRVNSLIKPQAVIELSETDRDLLSNFRRRKPKAVKESKNVETNSPA